MRFLISLFNTPLPQVPQKVRTLFMVARGVNFDVYFHTQKHTHFQRHLTNTQKLYKDLSCL